MDMVRSAPSVRASIELSPRSRHRREPAILGLTDDS